MLHSLQAFHMLIGAFSFHSLTNSSSHRSVFDDSSARWSKTPAPNPHTTVQVFGICSRVAVNGSLSVNIDNITLSIGT